MKHIKIGFVLLAVIFAVSSAFTTAKKVNNFSKAWFIYDDEGSPTSINSYTIDPEVEITCDVTEGLLCRVFTNVAQDGIHPVAADLSTLSSASSNFTERVDGELKVYLKE